MRGLAVALTERSWIQGEGGGRCSLGQGEFEVSSRKRCWLGLAGVEFRRDTVAGEMVLKRERQTE